MSRQLLDIRDLSITFDTPEGRARAVEGVDLTIAAGESLGLVGESGCGKSVTSLSILGLIPSPPGRVGPAVIRFEDRNLLDLDPEELQKDRGREISMIFQEPMTSLNPVLPIGRQVAEPLVIHQGLSRPQALASCGGLARPGEDPGGPAAARRLSPPVVRRHAAARDDRHGHGVRTEASDRRRTHDGPRCHHPGPDPEPDGGA